MSKLNVEIKKLVEIMEKDGQVVLRSEFIGNKIIKKRFGKYKIEGTNETVKKVSPNSIKNINTGDLYFNSNEIENVRKR